MVPHILAALALWFVQTLLASSFRYFATDTAQVKANLQDALGGRDDPPKMPTLGARSNRAQNNLLEALVVFLPLALIIEWSGAASGWATTGATVFVVARVLYVPAYLTAVPGVRSTVWMAGHIGLGMLLGVVLGWW